MPEMEGFAKNLSVVLRILLGRSSGRAIAPQAVQPRAESIKGRGVIEGNLFRGLTRVRQEWKSLPGHITPRSAQPRPVNAWSAPRLCTTLNASHVPDAATPSTSAIAISKRPVRLLP